MTVIAYRDGVIAGDGVMEFDTCKDASGSINAPCVKVAKRKGYLFGASGHECPALPLLMDAFFDHDDEAKATLRRYDFSMMVITPAFEIQIWDEKSTYEVIRHPFYAIGYGAQCALGAMHLGATAVQAVKACCKWVPGIGGKVAVRRLVGSS
jgi:hypothetical protein